MKYFFDHGWTRMNTDKKAGVLCELASIEFAVIRAIRVRILSKKDALFGEADSCPELQRVYPCSSVFIRGKNPLRCIVPAKHS